MRHNIKASPTRPSIENFTPTCDRPWPNIESSDRRLAPVLHTQVISNPRRSELRTNCRLSALQDFRCPVFSVGHRSSDQRIHDFKTTKSLVAHLLPSSCPGLCPDSSYSVVSRHEGDFVRRAKVSTEYGRFL